LQLFRLSITIIGCFSGAQDPPHEMHQFQRHELATTLKYLLLGLKKMEKRGE
jgi:hypothetical protein